MTRTFRAHHAFPALSGVLMLAFMHAGTATAQPVLDQAAFTRADSLRGSIGPERAWWDVTHYDVLVQPDFDGRSIQGTTTISFTATASGQRMQVDLQQPLEVLRTSFRSQDLTTERAGDVLWVDLPVELAPGTREKLVVHYAGKPRTARNPPWDGGWIWKTDARDNPWMTVACQGLGASAWYPCKDNQSDEPDSAALRIIVPDTLQAIGNGRLRSKTANGDGTTTWHWAVTSPINTYNLVPYIGKYQELTDTYKGLEGDLDLAFWVLRHHAPWGEGEFRANRELEEAALRRASIQFRQVPEMLSCFEDWLGPYPFYADGYKLVEAPHLGMEHQSAIAYGNKFQNGYLGQDLSGTGHGLKWDYIIVHESGHEWFGNSITTADIADMWVHEGFTQYTEVLMTECVSGKQAAEEYLIGLRRNIRNDRPIIGPYGVNEEGSHDMYPKGANVVHMVRQVLGDSAFKEMLRGMNRKYRHAIVTSSEIEAFMDGHTPLDLRPMFNQYLRDTRIPVLQWGHRQGRTWCRWTNCPQGFTMPVSVSANGASASLIVLGTGWAAPFEGAERKAPLTVDPNWYVRVERVPMSKLKGPKASDLIRPSPAP